MAGVLATIALLATTPSGLALLTGNDFRSDVNHAWFVFFGLAWATLLLAVVHGPAALRRPFKSAAMQWAGRVSFSAYLLHMPVLDWTTRALGLDGIAAVSVFLAMTALVSWASWWLIERPLQRVRWRS